MSSAHAEYHAAARARITPVLEGIETIDVATRCGTTTLQVSRDEVLEALTRSKAAGFTTISFVTVVDRMRDGEVKGPRFTLVHQLQSITDGHVVRFHTPLAEDDAIAPSVTGLWPGANYMEREAFDMFGVRFEGHPNLERLLMPDGYGHFPLRKEFPHQGIEPDRLYREWDERRRAKDILVAPDEQTPAPTQDR